MIEFLLAAISIGSVMGILYRLVTRFKNLYSYTPVDLSSTPTVSEGVSILICIKEDEPQFPKYLTKILEQEYALFEVIVVYEGTHPQMRSFFETLKDNPRVHVIDTTSIESPLVGKKKAMHFGLPCCQYDLVLMTDGDCYPESTQWITQMVSKKQGHQIVLGASPYISDSTWLNRWIRYDNMMVSLFYLSYTLSNKPYMGMGRNMLFDQSIWTQNYEKTYGKYGYGDDDMLVQSVPYAAVTVMMDSLVYSFPQRTWIGWIHQKLRHLKIGKKYSPAILKDLALFPLLTFLFWASMWVWSSFFRMHVLWVFILIVYLILKMTMTAMIEHKLKIKNKVWYLTPLFDFYYAVMQLLFPFLSLIYRVKWK